MPSVLNLPSGLIQLPYGHLESIEGRMGSIGNGRHHMARDQLAAAGYLVWWSAGRGIEALIAGSGESVGGCQLLSG